MSTVVLKYLLNRLISSLPENVCCRKADENANSVRPDLNVVLPS